MKKQPDTKAESIRLTLVHWTKLRALMTHHGGRAWLEKILDREHKRVFTPNKEPK